MAEPAIELLVHIAAPTRASDDDRYRSLAQAYLVFEPSLRVSMAKTSGSSDKHRAGFMSSQYGVDASFGDVSHNLGSPRPQDVPSPPNGGQELHSSWHTPASIVPDSMPNDKVTISQFCSPTRILEYYLSGVESSQASTKILDVPKVSEAPKVVEPATEVIPLSPTMGIKRDHAVISSPLSSDKEILIPSSIYLPSSTRSESEPPSAKRRRSVLAEDYTKGLERRRSDLGPCQDQHKDRLDRVQARKIRRACLSLDGLEIRAPDPPISDQDIEPSAMVTDKLALLARDVDIRRYFVRRATHKRDIRPLERGHWYIDCTRWDTSKRNDMWRFLTHYIGAGHAGWGVWCKRDQDFTHFRIYCWGQIVGHIYSLLYLATKKEIRNLDLPWVAADGQEIVRVPAKRQNIIK